MVINHRPLVKAWAFTWDAVTTFPRPRLWQLTTSWMPQKQTGLLLSILRLTCWFLGCLLIYNLNSPGKDDSLSSLFCRNYL